MKKALIRKIPATFVLLHISVIGLIITSLLTGLRIRSDHPDSILSSLEFILPQGDVWFWHVFSGLILAGLFFSYLWFYWRRRKKLIPNKKSLYARPSHTIAYSLLMLLVLGSLVTGVLHLLDSYSNTASLVHRLCAYGYGLFIALHTLAHIKQSGFRQLLRVLRPTRSLKFFFSSLGVLLIAAAGSILWMLNNATTLNAYYTRANIEIDGRADEPAWQVAQEVSVLTKHGAHLVDGQSRVTVKALYDAENLYLYFTWQDPTRSQKHLPLLKTEQGWQIQQSRFERADENEFYEDKFAVLLAHGDALAISKSIHLGKRPLKNKPDALNERGYHYTTNGKIYDLWHWQSVRSNMHYQADDSHFGPPIEVAKSFPRTFEERQGGTYERYTAGYQKDPPGEPEWSGVSMNWESYSTGFTQPRRLLIEEDDIRSLQSDSLKAHVSDKGNWWLTWDDTKPYSKYDDNYAIGAVLPGVLIKPKRVGDRADVVAHGRWQDGYWHLEIKRALDTGSPFDVALNNQTYLWFAVFDRTQTRHSRHLRPVRLNFDKKEK